MSKVYLSNLTVGDVDGTSYYGDGGTEEAFKIITVDGASQFQPGVGYHAFYVDNGGQLQPLTNSVDIDAVLSAVVYYEKTVDDKLTASMYVLALAGLSLDLVTSSTVLDAHGCASFYKHDLTWAIGDKSASTWKKYAGAVIFFNEKTKLSTGLVYNTVEDSKQMTTEHQTSLQWDRSFVAETVRISIAGDVGAVVTAE